MEEKKLIDLKCSCGKVFKWKNVKWEIYEPDGFIENVHHVCECGKIQRSLLILDIMASEYLVAKNDTKKLRAFVEKRLGEKWELPEKSDWKILDVNCLPEDILVGDYEFIQELSIRLDIDPFTDGASGRCSLLNEIYSTGKEYCYRYRPTPTKKTHEELAEEYSLHPYTESSWKKEIKNAFIAGRKSMESEK